MAVLYLLRYFYDEKVVFVRLDVIIKEIRMNYYTMLYISEVGKWLNYR